MSNGDYFLEERPYRVRMEAALASLARSLFLVEVSAVVSSGWWRWEECERLLEFRSDERSFSSYWAIVLSSSSGKFKTTQID